MNTEAAAAPSAGSPPRSGSRRAWLLRAGGLLLLAALIAYLVARKQLDLAAILRVLAGANPALVALSVGIYFPFVLIKSERWRLLAAGLGVRMGLGEAWRLYAIGLGAGAFTPGQAGDLVKAWALERRGHRLGAAVASSVLDRLFDIAGLAPLALLGLWVFGQTYGGGLGAVAVISAGAVAAVIAFARREQLMRLVGKRLSGVGGQWSVVSGQQSAVNDELSAASDQPSAEILRFAQNDSGSALRTPHSALRTPQWAVAAGWTALSFAVSTFRVWLLAVAIGLHLDLAQVGGIVGLTTVAALIPVSVSGVGTRDATMVALLGQLGQTAEAAIALSTLILVLNIANAIFGYAVWWVETRGQPSATSHQPSAVSRQPSADDPHSALRTRVALVVGAVAALILAGWIAVLVARPGQPPVPEACRDTTPYLQSNLLANSGLEMEPGITPTLTSWVVSGTLGAGGQAGWAQPNTGTDLMAARVLVRANDRYCYSAETGGSGHVQMMVRFQAATLKGVIADSVQAPQPAGSSLRGEATAPEGAAYAWVWLRAIDGSPTFKTPLLAQEGVRVETWPDGARAAFAFSFDWESAMGGLIHSKSQHDVVYAANRGMNMRQGADMLLDLFKQHGIRATFYATGYNLLDGNTERRKFSGDPTYKVGPGKLGGWATTWWLTNTWYSDDPYGTIASDPAWYFGDQTDRLHAAGQEIGSHTFGHLYVRGTKPLSLTVDLGEWDKAAAARGLPTARTFAFPWQSSNSLDDRFYKVLEDHGITSVTRLYPPDLPDRYLISASQVYSPVLVMPDLHLGPVEPNTGDAGPNTPSVAGVVQARAVISDVVSRRGATSFWTHPEDLTKPGVRDVWVGAITAAADARDRGDLWIAPVSEITQRWRDIRLVTTTYDLSGDHLSITVVNGSPDTLDGVTITLPHPARAVQVNGKAVSQRRPEQVDLPAMPPGGRVHVEVDLVPGGGG